MSDCDRKHKEGMQMDFVNARDARNLLKMLMGNGGAAQIRLANKIRLLIHDEKERPLHMLPWPLKLLQAHSFRYVVYEKKTKIEERHFTRRQLIMPSRCS